MSTHDLNEHDFVVRNANKTDLDQLMSLEQSWPPDQRAEAGQFLSRLELFPEGFLVGEYQGTIIASTTTCLAHYNPEDLSGFNSWNKATNNGYLHPRTDITDPNALYVVSTIVKKEFRGRGLLEAFHKIRRKLAFKLGVDYLLTGAILPGYDSYCARHGEISAYEYACLRQNGIPIDPLLGKLALLGYELADEKHLIANYYQSTESRDYAALLVCRLTSGTQ